MLVESVRSILGDHPNQMRKTAMLAHAPKSSLQSAGTMSRAELRRAQLEWLQWLCERSGDTLSVIARNAEKNPGTLTELRNPDKDRVLSDATVEDIKARYGVPGPLEFRAAPGFAEEAVPFQGAREEESATTDRWEIRSNALEALGILPGDELFVDLSLLPEDGDIVCAQIFTGPMSATTVFRLYRTHQRFPFLTTAYFDQRKNVMDIVGLSDVAIKGVVRRTSRPIRPN